MGKYEVLVNKETSKSFCDKYGTNLGLLQQHINDFQVLLQPGVAFIGGGLIRAWINQEPVADIDFFVPNAYMAFQVKERLFEMGWCLQDRNSENALFFIRKEEEPPVQIITRKYLDTVQAYMDDVDYTISQFAFDGEFIYWTDLALYDTKYKKLTLASGAFSDTNSVASTAIRFFKYWHKGYQDHPPFKTICALADKLNHTESFGKVEE